MPTMKAAPYGTIVRNTAHQARDASGAARMRAERTRMDAPNAAAARPAEDEARRPTSAAKREIPAVARPILERLDRRGPCEVADIPRRWPLTRMHVTYVVQKLVDAGLAEWIHGTGSGPRRVRLTEAGRRAVAA